MPKRAKRSNGRPVRIFLLAVLGFALVIKLLLHGTNVALFNPKGFIAHEQMGLMIFSVVLLLTVAVPTLAVLYFMAWKYREGNAKATYEPDARKGKYLELSMWGIPSVFMLVMIIMLWPAAHRLDPKKAVAAETKPITVQVVAMRWKWLFIYPEQRIATVNFVQMPVDTPVKFELTADDTPMSSFWIPNLGGMLYAMTGHVNELNLMATKPGDYTGSTAEINGAGFAGMRFTARASSRAEFDNWVQQVRLSADELDQATYDKLVQPDEDHPVVYYSEYDSGLYDKVLMKYMAHEHSHGGGE